MLLYAVTDRTWLREGQTLAQVTEDVLQTAPPSCRSGKRSWSAVAFLAEARELQAAAAARPRSLRGQRRRGHRPGAATPTASTWASRDIVGRDVRALIGPDKILGISANTVETAVAAQAAGADYIGVGAVFGTSTKKDAKSLSGARSCGPSATRWTYRWWPSAASTRITCPGWRAAAWTAWRWCPPSLPSPIPAQRRSSCGLWRRRW